MPHVVTWWIIAGWSSSADPLSNTLIDFASKEEAVAFAEKNQWAYILEVKKKHFLLDSLSKRTMKAVFHGTVVGTRGWVRVFKMP